MTETNRRSYTKIAERYLLLVLKAFANVSAFHRVIAHNDRTIKIVVVQVRYVGWHSSYVPAAFQTWACLAVSIIIMGPILYLIHKYSPYSTKASGLNSSWQCVWYVYGALLQQGTILLSRKPTLFLLYLHWWKLVIPPCSDFITDH